jgi:membrane protein implicated in regulation of membrane protease activity
VIAAFVGLFFLGLIAAVRVMLYGVERQRPVGDSSPRSFSVSPAIVASFAVVAGMVGYLLAKFDLSPAGIWSVAIGAGLIAGGVTVRAVARWWQVVPEHDVDDERYVLQGSLGRVVALIAERGLGKVSLEGGPPSRVMPARAIDDHSVAVGTEVVIERIEDGVAYVEQWAEVEKRL